MAVMIVGANACMLLCKHARLMPPLTPRWKPRSQTRKFAGHNTDHVSHERNNLSGRLLMADFDDGQESNPMLEKAKLSHIEYLRKTERRKNSAQVATKVAMRRDERLERERLKKQKEEQLALIKANEVQYDAEGNPIKVKKSDKRAVATAPLHTFPPHEVIWQLAALA